MSGLFREEVLDAQRGEWMGSVNLATPLSFVWWTLMAAGLGTAIVLFLTFGHYTHHKTVTGQLLPNSGVLTLSIQMTGTVARTFVNEGQRVAAGEQLVEISSDLFSASMGDTHALVSSQLRAQQSQLRTTITNLKPQFDGETKDLRRRIGMLREQMRQIDGQLTLQHQQAATAAQLLQKAAPLQKRGFISAIELGQYQATALSEQAGIKGLERQRLDSEQQLSTLQTQLERLPLDIAARTNELSGQLGQLDAQLAESEVQRRAVLSAPLAGIVSNLLVKPGQNISNSQPLVSILPQGSKLEAQLLVPSNAIGFIKPGNPVVLRYEAYPFQKFGQQFGHVAQVSRSALSNAEVASLTGTTVTEPLYRVLVALDRQTIDAYGKAEALMPGMALSADIMLDRSSLLQWMFEPLQGLKQQLVDNPDRHK